MRDDARIQSFVAVNIVAHADPRDTTRNANLYIHDKNVDSENRGCRELLSVQRSIDQTVRNDEAVMRTYFNNQLDQLYFLTVVHNALVIEQ